MGWLKRFLSKTEDFDTVDEPLKECVSLDSLRRWVDERVDSEFSKICKDVETEASILIDSCDNMKKVLSELSSAELQNPDLPEKEIQVMEGNRETYIRAHKRFINNIQIADDLTCSDANALCNAVELDLIELAKSTAKGHAVMNFFFGNHAAAINKNRKRIGSAIDNIKGILEDSKLGAHELEQLYSTISDFESKHKAITELKHELERLNKKKENSTILRSKLVSKMDGLKQGDEYSVFLQANEKKDSLKLQLRKLKEDLSSRFFQLDRPMRKFSRMLVEDTELFKRYMDDPFNALLADKEIRIMVLLARMKTSLKKGSLEVKDAEKAINRIDAIDKAFLQDIQESATHIKETIRTIDKQIRSSKVTSDLEDLRYKLDHAESQMELLKEKIGYAQKSLARIDLNLVRDKVSGIIKDNFGMDILITVHGLDNESTGKDSEAHDNDCSGRKQEDAEA